jgi:hypothetical protein
VLDKVHPTSYSYWLEGNHKGIREWRGRSLKATVCKLARAAAVYNMWRKRNRVMGNGKFKAASENAAICSSGVSLKIFCFSGCWCLLIEGVFRSCCFCTKQMV